METQDRQSKLWFTLVRIMNVGKCGKKRKDFLYQIVKEKLWIHLIISGWSEILLKDAKDSVFLFCGEACCIRIGRDNKHWIVGFLPHSN